MAIPDEGARLGDALDDDAGTAGTRPAGAPAELSSSADLAAALTSLREAAGLSIRAVSRRTGIPSATLGGYFAGRHLPQVGQLGTFTELLQALGVPAEQLSDWQDAVLRLRRSPDRRAHDAPSPYRGLDSYRVEDAAWFVGRDAEVDRLAREVDSARQGNGPRMVALVGASGSGKSSLLHAGLIARALQEGWDALGVEPGDPVGALESLEALLASGSSSDRRLVVVDQLEEIFAPGVAPAERGRFLDTLGDLASGRDGWVVVVGLRADRYQDAMAQPVLVPALSAHQVLLGPPSLTALSEMITRPALLAGRSVAEELVDLLVTDLHGRGRDHEVGALPLLSHVLWQTWERCRGEQLTVADYFGAGGLHGAVQKTAEHIYRDVLGEEDRAASRDLFLRLVSLGESGRPTRRPLPAEELAGLESLVGAYLDGRILTATDDVVQISHDALLWSWPRLAEWVQEDRDALGVRRRIRRAASLWYDSEHDRHSLLGGTMLELATSLGPRAEAMLTARERDFIAESVAADVRRQAVRNRRRRGIRALFAGVAALALVASVLSVVLVVEVGNARDQRRAATQAESQALSRQVAVQAEGLREKNPSLAAQLALAAYRLSPTVEARSALLSTTALPATSRLTTAPGSTFVTARPDGHVFAVAGGDGKIRVYDHPRAGHAPVLAATVPAYGGQALFAAAFSPDGRLFATAGAAGKITVLDMSQPQHPVRWDRPLAGPDSGVFGLAFSPGSDTLVATGGRALLRWRISSARATALPRVTGFGDPVQSVAVSARGLVAAGTTDGAVSLWRPHGSRLDRIADLDQGATNTVWSLAFSPDGRLLAAGSRDERVRVWRVAAKPRLVTDQLSGFTSWVNTVSFSPDGRELAAGASGSLTRVWRTKGWKLQESLPQTANVTSVVLLPGGGLLSAGIDGVVRLRSSATPTLGGFGDAVSGIDITGDGDLLYVGPRSTEPDIRPVDTSRPGTMRQTGTVLTAPRRAGSPDQVVAISPDDSTLVVGTREGNLIVWRLHDRTPGGPMLLKASKALIEEAAFSPDGRFFASVSDDGTVSVYAAPTDARSKPHLVHRLQAGGMGLNIRFSPDSSLLAVAGVDQQVHLWRFGPDGSVDELAPLGGFDNYVVGLAFSPDGHLLAAGSADHTIRLWDVEDPGHPRMLERLTGPTNSVLSLSFSRDGHLLAAAGHDGIVWLWSMHPSGAPSLDATLAMPYPDTRSLVFDPTSARLIAGSGAGSLREWDTDPDTAAEQVCATAGAGVTRAEWSQYFTDTAYAPPCR